MKVPFIAYSEISDEIYIICGREKYCVTEQVISAMKATNRMLIRPKGNWIKTDKDCYICSKCKYIVFYSGDMSNYCPDCGADMRGDT